jgi:hypothetical protein
MIENANAYENSLQMQINYRGGEGKRVAIAMSCSWNAARRQSFLLSMIGLNDQEGFHG